MNKAAVKTEVDAHRLIFHPRRVGDWLDDRLVYPIYMELGLTNRCNHRCVFCGLDWVERGRVDIDRDVMCTAISDIAAAGVKSVMFAGEGEPFLHPDACRFVAHARACGLDVSVNTNGAVFDEEKARQCLPHLSWIRFSLDAGTAATHALVHGTSPREFARILAHIEAAARIKREQNLSVTVGVQTLVIPQNLNELLETVKVVKAAGADNLQIKPYSHNPYSKHDFAVDPAVLDSLAPELTALEDEHFQVCYRRNTLARIREGKTYPECYGLSFFALTDVFGNVIPCNMFYGQPEFVYGNLYSERFAAIWEGPRRREVLARLRTRGVNGCTTGCRLEGANRYLHELKNPHPHVNFI